MVDFQEFLKVEFKTNNFTKTSLMKCVDDPYEGYFM